VVTVVIVVTAVSVASGGNPSRVRTPKSSKWLANSG